MPELFTVASQLPGWATRTVSTAWMFATPGAEKVTGIFLAPSDVPAGTVTVTSVLTLPAPGTVMLPDDGEIVIPSTVDDDQVQVRPVPERSWMPTDAVPLAPAGTTARTGSTKDRLGVSWSRNDGGASAGALPHAVAVPVSAKSSLPPVESSASGIHGFDESTPLTFRPETYCPAPVPVTTIFLPAPVVSVVFGNSGEFSTSSERPGISGYMPSADQTYQADIWPRSSLPTMPSGRGLYSSVIDRRTIDCVLAGEPA